VPAGVAGCSKSHGGSGFLAAFFFLRKKSGIPKKRIFVRFFVYFPQSYGKMKSMIMTDFKG
jgi:hypothetical protein